jgi:nitronate monooxygenase
MRTTVDRTTEFCTRLGFRVPILLAPMDGASAPAVSAAVANAGGLGACGALLMVQAWAGQSAARGSARPAVDKLRRRWDDARAILA